MMYGLSLELYAKYKQEDELRAAEQRRLVRLAQRGRPAGATAPVRLLARLGNLLVDLGARLQGGAGTVAGAVREDAPALTTPAARRAAGGSAAIAA